MSVHVQATVYSGWIVRMRGSKRALKRFATLKAAEAFGRAEARRRGVWLYVHRQNGSVRVARQP